VEWDESLTAVPSPERRSEVAEEVRLLSDAIGALPRRLSDVLVLHYLEGLSYAEVADALALPVSTIKGRLFESRGRLRRSLVACGVREPDETREDVEQSEHAERRMTSQKRTRKAKERTHMTETRGVGANRMGVGDHLRVEVDVDEITQEAERFITESWPRPTPRATLDELGSPRNRFLSLEVLEHMVLDGVSKEQDVRPFVDWCLAEWGMKEHTDPEVAALTERLRARGAR
jgi:hypothetical protein